jgi:hypothetical protein
MKSGFERVEDAAPKFKVFCENVQSIGIAVGVLVGGLWSAYTFWSLKSVEKANLEYLRNKERSPAINAEVATTLIAAEVDIYSNLQLETPKQVFINVTVH